jgi:hypothetical protein
VKNRRTTLGLLAGAMLVLAIAAAVLAAAPSMRWRLIGSGGGPVQGSGYALASAVGQPASGKVSNGYTIYSGLYLEAFAPGPVKHYALVPTVMNRLCMGMPSSVEIEPNDRSDQANGILCPNVVYSGNPNYRGAGRDDDWFKFYWSGQGTITIELDNFLTAGQLLLYYNPDGPYLTREYDQPDRHYTVTYTGKGQAGTYYILVFAPAGHDTTTGNYTLTYH